MFPRFSLFVRREAKIACNPLISLHALKSDDRERLRLSKIQSILFPVSSIGPPHLTQTHDLHPSWKTTTLAADAEPSFCVIFA